MRARTVNRLIQLVMIAALAVTGYPIVATLVDHWRPAPLQPRPAAATPQFAEIEVNAVNDLTPEQIRELDEEYRVDLRLEYRSDGDYTDKVLFGTVPAEQEASVLERLSQDERVESAEEVDQIAVDAKDTLTPSQLADLNARYGLSLDYNSPQAAAEKLLVAEVTPESAGALVDALRKDPLVEAADLTHVVTLAPGEEQRQAVTPLNRKRSGSSWTPNDPLFGEQWNMEMVGAEKAWEKKATGKGVVVAVIDTGVAFESDERCYLAKDFGGTPFVKGYDFVNDDAHPNDDHGHGTHVAGTIAETTNNAEGAAGLAFDASIMPLKVLSAFGSGTTADIADAIRFAADHGAKVINMSLGGPYPDTLMRNACKYAAKKGVLIVCAAGNSGGGPVGYPAAFPECVAVSSVGPSGELAFYSSIGKEVAIAAPGGDQSERQEDGITQNTVIDGVDDYYAFQGTSMASPHVAATAALAMSRGVTDPEEVKQLLKQAATPKKPAEKYGAGILSASKTVDLADAARRNSFLKLIVSVIAFVTGLGVGVIRKQLGGLTKFPFLPFGFVIGFWGPDFIFGWLGFGSPFSIVLHSALIPLFLLSEAESKAVYRFIGAMAVGMAVHLGWDALTGQGVGAGILPIHATPWLWVNAVVGLGVALAAWRRSFSAPA